MEYSEFFSVAGLATVAGAVAATKVLTTWICNYSPRWAPKLVAGVVAILIQLFVWGAMAATAGAFDWVALVLALVNAGVVYLGATGMNAIAAAQVERKQARQLGGPAGRGSARWF